MLPLVHSTGFISMQLHAFFAAGLGTILCFIYFSRQSQLPFESSTGMKKPSPHMAEKGESQFLRFFSCFEHFSFVLNSLWPCIRCQLDQTSPFIIDYEYIISLNSVMQRSTSKLDSQKCINATWLPV